MDNGEVIPSLNEPWTMGGAKVSEWTSGFVMLIVFQEIFLDSSSRNMPFLLAIWLITTFGMAALRRSFPDEERGLANMCLTAVGIDPPGIPTPSALQPLWSGCPVRALPEDCDYIFLELDKLFESEEDEDEDNDPYY